MALDNISALGSTSAISSRYSASSSPSPSGSGMREPEKGSAFTNAPTNAVFNTPATMTQDSARLANRASFAFVAPSLPSDQLQVRRVVGQEELSRPFSFQITLVSEERHIDLDALVGEPAQLRIQGMDGTRVVHGIVERFRHLVSGRHYVHYEAILASPLQMLRYTRNSRIFQQSSTLEIVQDVLATSPLQLEIRLALMGTYGPRDFCVQYQESDLDFISRLLEEDGIFYYLDHTGEHPVLVLGDGPHAVEPLPQGEVLEFHNESRATVQEQEAVYDFRAEAALRSGGTVMRDFRFKNPGVSLEAKRVEDRFQSLETYYYPGGYVSPELGRELARIRLEAQVRDRQRFTGTATVRGLVPGHRFTLDRHDRDDFNRTYLICTVEHEGTETPALLEESGESQTEPSTYRARFECIPVDVPFRPSLQTPRPIIAGLQTAVVVGPGTEEIHCDTFGRVKVHFHWDRQGSSDENDSCWIRVGQSWGGPGFGSVFVPRIGQEVLVQFIEGDPDRPMIVGVVYNGQNSTPYGLPAAKTQSGIKSRTTPGGGGFNELRFEDSAGKEEVFLHGELDMNTVIKRDHTQQYGRDRDTNIGRHNTIKVAQKEVVEVGNTQNLTVGSDRTVKVVGNQQTTIQQNQVLSVTQNQVKQVGGSKTQWVQGANTQIIQNVSKLFTKKDRIEVVRANSSTTTAKTATLKQQDLLISSGGNNLIMSQRTAQLHSGVILIEAVGAPPPAPPQPESSGIMGSIMGAAGDVLGAVSGGVGGIAGGLLGAVTGGGGNTPAGAVLGAVSGLMGGGGAESSASPGCYGGPSGGAPASGSASGAMSGSSTSGYLSAAQSASVSSVGGGGGTNTMADPLGGVLSSVVGGGGIPGADAFGAMGAAGDLLGGLMGGGGIPGGMPGPDMVSLLTEGGLGLVAGGSPMADFELAPQNSGGPPEGGAIVMKAQETVEVHFGKTFLVKFEEEKKEEAQGSEEGGEAGSGGGDAEAGEEGEKKEEPPKETMLIIEKESFILKVGDSEIKIDSEGIQIMSKKKIKIIGDGVPVEIAGDPINLN